MWVEAAEITEGIIPESAAIVWHPMPLQRTWANMCHHLFTRTLP